MSNKSGRRNFLLTSGSTAAALLFWKDAKADFSIKNLLNPASDSVRGANTSFVSVQAPGVPTTQGTLTGNVREFRLTAEPVTIQLPDMSDGMGMKGRP
jgi:hypothetical protein